MSETLPEEAIRVDGPRRAKRTLILAHGAGSGMDSDFMDTVARGLAEREVRVIRFEFLYMQRRRETGSKRPPDREPILRATWQAVFAQFADANTAIGGKSMGGRIATLVAAELQPAAVVCLGYPFHPPGKPAQLRTSHFETLKIPTLIVQGERDPFGTHAEVETLCLPNSIELAWIPDGDHSLKPRKSSGHTLDENLRRAIEAVDAFLPSAA